MENTIYTKLNSSYINTPYRFIFTVYDRVFIFKDLNPGDPGYKENKAAIFAFLDLFFDYPEEGKEEIDHVKSILLDSARKKDGDLFDRVGIKASALEAFNSYKVS